MAPSPGGLSRDHFSRKWGRGPETAHGGTERTETMACGSNARRRGTREASQVSSKIKSEEGSLLEGLRVVEGRPFVRGAPKRWFRRLRAELDKKGLRLEQLPKVKIQKKAGGFFLSKKFVRAMKRELLGNGAA